MTPQFLVGLAALLIDLREWIESERPASLDVAMVNAVIDVCVNERSRITQEGSR